MFVRNGYPPERIAVSPYGLDYGWLPADKQKESAPGLRVGYLGQIEPLKGVDLLVRAFRQLDAPEASLTIHGNHLRNPTYTAELGRLSSGDPRIHLAGPFKRDERAAVLRSLDVVVTPSRWYENAPFVISEAHAMKTPVIATNLGGMAEVVRDGENGLLFDPDDENSLTDCLRRIMADPGLLARLRAGIRPPRTVADDAAGLRSLYEQLMETPVSPVVGAVSRARSSLV
jgi:glycosyltransferase involved in cell wall biosynthesis